MSRKVIISTKKYNIIDKFECYFYFFYVNYKSSVYNSCVTYALTYPGKINTINFNVNSECLLFYQRRMHLLAPHIKL